MLAVAVTGAVGAAEPEAAVAAACLNDIGPISYVGVIANGSDRGRRRCWLRGVRLVVSLVCLVVVCSVVC